MYSFIADNFKESLALKKNFFENSQNLDIMASAIEQMITSLRCEGKILSCGNGGSMCDAMHFAEELTGRFRKDRSALPAIAISDPSHISCVANDYGFEYVFSKYIEAHGKKGDSLVAISTSGNSENVIKAVEAAKDKGLKTIGLLGKDGGKLKNLVDFPIIISAHTSDRIQELHILIIHTFIEGIERSLFKENYPA